MGLHKNDNLKPLLIDSLTDDLDFIYDVDSWGLEKRMGLAQGEDSS